MGDTLAGIKVLDFSRAVAGAFGAMLLSDMGAEVNKVENVPGADPPITEVDEIELTEDIAHFWGLNRGKRGICLDLQKPSAREVVYDLIKTLGKAVNQSLINEIKEKTGLDEVLFVATHTHAAPDLYIAEDVGSLPNYERQVYARTIVALQEAWNDLEPVRLGVGRGSADLNYNRIKKLPDNRVQMIWENPEKKPLGRTIT